MDLSLTDDFELLCECLSLGLGLAGGLDGLDLSLNVVELASLLLSECLILDLSLLQRRLRLLLVLIRVLLRLSLLHLRSDLDG